MLNFHGILNILIGLYIFQRNTFVKACAFERLYSTSLFIMFSQSLLEVYITTVRFFYKYPPITNTEYSFSIAIFTFFKTIQKSLVNSLCFCKHQLKRLYISSNYMNFIYDNILILLLYKDCHHSL